MTSTHTDEAESRPLLANPWRVLILALLVGVGIDLLVLRHPIGLGAAIVGVLLGGGVLVGRVFYGVRASNDSILLAGALVFWSVLLTTRTAPMLVFLNTVGVLLLVGLTFRLLRSGGLAGWTVGRYATNGLRTLGGWIAEPFRFFSIDFAAQSTTGHRLGRLGKVAVGALIAVPLIAVFAALFSSADAAFEESLQSLLNVDIGPLVGHVIAIAVFAWLAIGAARHAVQDHPSAAERSRPILGAVEAGTALLLLDALFLVFVILEARYLFAFRETLARDGLTYAQYARRGFFELVFVGALVVAVVLVVDWMVQTKAVRSKVVDALNGGLIVLTLVVLLSAAQRMRLYTDAYGLTELRLYTSVFMGWVALVLVWMVTTVLRGRRERFALGAFVSAFAVLAVLTLANPAAIIVRTNVAHAVATSTELDAVYLADLGADAIPAMIEGVDAAMACRDRANLAGMTMQTARNVSSPGLDWRAWTWSRFRAEHVYADAEFHLATLNADRCR